MAIDEVKKAVFDMFPFKVPGPDGFQAVFYQKNWDVLGYSVWNFERGVFEGMEQNFEVNDTLIVLILEVDIPEMLNNFRLISLCNVVYKVITKLIANRL